MEQTLELIEIIVNAVVLIFIGSLIWEITSKGSMSCKVTQLVLTTVSFALQIPRLVLRIFLNQPYGIIICLLCIWALNVAMDSLIIGAKVGEKSASTKVAIEIRSD